MRVEIELDEEQETALQAVADYWSKNAQQEARRAFRMGLELADDERKLLQDEDRALHRPEKDINDECAVPKDVGATKAEQAEIKSRVKALVDRVHDLLNGPEGTGQLDGPQDTMRVVLEIPKAWILLGAWVELTSRKRRLGKFEVAEVEDRDDGHYWKRERYWARRRIHKAIDSLMHAHLHELAIGVHGYLYPLPPPQAPRDPGDLDDELPF